MKQFICLTLCVFLAVSLYGCGKEPGTETEAPPLTTSAPETTAPVMDTLPLPTEGDALQPLPQENGTWTKGEERTISGKYVLRLPEFDTAHEADGICGITKEDRLCLVAGNTATALSLETVFQDNAPEILQLLEEGRSTAYSDYSMVLEDNSLVEVNGTTMGKVRGVYSFDNAGTVSNWRFIGYCVRLSDGSFGYWLASYPAGENFQEVKRTAQNMAYTFREVAQ